MAKDLLKGGDTLKNGVNRGERERTCIIIGAGDFTPVDIDIHESDLCVAVDGGYLYCKMLGIVPDLIVGDMDSIDEKILEEIREIKKTSPDKVIILNSEKDDTDTIAALKIGLKKGFKMFRIYGAMGGRIEHTIANIQCLRYLKNHGAKAYIMDAFVMMTVIENETADFNPSMEGYMSLFALSDRAEGVTITGMKYPLDKATVQSDYPIGISNEFIGQEGHVTVENGMLLLIVTWA